MDIELTAHLADLSKLAFTPEELAVMTEEMDGIVALMDTVSDFEPCATITQSNGIPLDGCRVDKKTPSLGREELLSNAAEKEKTFFKVPKVV